MRVFAAGDSRRLEIQVTWRSGKRSLVREARPNCVYEIDESFAEVPTNPPPRPAAPLFEDASSRLNHVHVDVPFNDFDRQPLLPRKLSGLGPGVCWADVNADGAEDLIIAGGNGGRTTIFHNDLKGGSSNGHMRLPRTRIPVIKRVFWCGAVRTAPLRYSPVNQIGRMPRRMRHRSGFSRSKETPEPAQVRWGTVVRPSDLWR